MTATAYVDSSILVRNNLLAEVCCIYHCFDLYRLGYRSWYKAYRLEQVAKEYYIIKPLLGDDRRYGPFIHALDSAIISSGVDEVCEKIYGRPEKK